MTIGEFRIWLKRRLHDRAAGIQSGFACRIPTSKELDDVVSLVNLANDADNVSEHVFLLFLKLMLIGGLESCFDAVSADYFQKINAEFPSDATDLVRRLIMSSLRHPSSTRSLSRR